MLKKILFISAIALVALAPNAFSQNCGDDACIDVTIRDFPVDRHGFEMFDGNQGGSGVCAGSNQGNGVTTNAVSPQTNYKNGICFDGERYVPCGESEDRCPVETIEGKQGIPNCGSNQLRYGGGGGTKGYCNGPDRKENGNCGEWFNAVFVTKGMVQEELAYDPDYCDEWGLTDDIGCENVAKLGLTPCPNYIKYRDCAYPKKNNGHCNSEDLEGWFRDISREHARVFRDSMVLKPSKTGTTFEINYDGNTSTNWNGYGNDNGYFPLDKYEIKKINDIYDWPSFGMQSINEWCPNNSGATCRQWYEAGGPRDGEAARKAVGNSPKLHNYNFSMAGSANFKYEAGKGDLFEFIGDDDMWIFIDGKLVPEGDLGGVHLAAPARIWIDEYAQKMDWENGTRHVVNFFYLDRNTDGSNMKLKLALTDMAPVRDGKLRIVKAETTLNSDGTASTIIWVSSRLDLESIENIKNNPDAPWPILVDKVSGGKDNVYGYKLTSIETLNDGKMDGGAYMYKITGAVCENKDKCEWVINSGDSLSFNVTKERWNADVAVGGVDPKFKGTIDWGLTSDDYRVKATGGLKVEELSWGRNTTDAAPIDPAPKPTDNTPVKPPLGDPNLPDGGIFTGGGPSYADPSVPKGAGGKVPSGGGTYDQNGFKGTPINIGMVWDADNGMMKIGDVSGVNEADNEVHSFGVVGNQIPPQRAGEMILTAFPSFTNQQDYNNWINSEDFKYFGLPPQSVDANGGQWWGLVDPSKSAPDIDGHTTGGYAFVKNGFPNESSVKGHIKVAPTRCTTQSIDADGAHINCLNFSLEARQPFQLAVTIYDQLGNFVTQYREKVTEQEFRNAVQAPSYGEAKSDAAAMAASEKCVAPSASNYGAPNVLTTSGTLNVNVNIYPFSANGRRFGNGVYIAKIDKVDLPFKDKVEGYNGPAYTCINNLGTPVEIEPSYSRQHAEKKFGWMRSGSVK